MQQRVENLIEFENKRNKKTLKVKVFYYVYPEDDIYAAYCPSLDLASQGSSKKEANGMMKDAIKEFFSFCLSEKTIFDVLESLGWYEINHKYKLYLDANNKADLKNFELAFV